MYYEQVITLIAKMERLREAPLQTGIHTSMTTWHSALTSLTTLRHADITHFLVPPSQPTLPNVTNGQHVVANGQQNNGQPPAFGLPGQFTVPPSQPNVTNGQQAVNNGQQPAVNNGQPPSFGLPGQFNVPPPFYCWSYAFHVTIVQW